MDNKLIGNRIKERRLELDLTLQDVANAISVNKSTIQRYESGSIKSVKLPVIESIAEYLTVSSSWLLGESEIKKHSEEYERVTHLTNIYFRSIMKWSEDKLFSEQEAINIREHFSELLFRYKEITTRMSSANINWKHSKDSFIELYKNKSEQEIKELFFKNELDQELENIKIWIDEFPNRMSNPNKNDN